MVAWLDDESFPSRFVDPEELDNFLSRPSRALATDLAAIDGDIIVLGVGGKMGPTLARLAAMPHPVSASSAFRVSARSDYAKHSRLGA